MELTTTTFVSADGVMQGVGGPGETVVADSSAGGWTTPLFDTDTATCVNYILTGQRQTVAGLRPEERGVEVSLTAHFRTW